MPTIKKRDPKKENDWSDLVTQWRIRPDTTYLNHGSFSPPPNCVRYARRGFIDRLDENPMDFYLRQMEELLLSARESLANFVGTEVGNLVFVDNATYAMNVVAKSFPLSAGDEVLINNHEYGAVHRIWERKCDELGAKKVTCNLPVKIESEQQVIDSLLAGVTDKTRLLVISHITSATALILPIKKICAEFASRGIAVCVDGPHAPAQIDLDIADLGCDFYTASCHKWLCATLGTGFLYVRPKWHEHVQPIMKSWGRLLPAVPETWDEEFTWMGSRDPSGFLSIPVAIDFMKGIGLESFRARSRELATYAEQSLLDLYKASPSADREQGWYGSMAHVPMPAGDWGNLQLQLWEQVGIEVMIINFNDCWHTRVSCHLYNNKVQIDTLVKALSRLMKS